MQKLVVVLCLGGLSMVQVGCSGGCGCAPANGDAADAPAGADTAGQPDAATGVADAAVPSPADAAVGDAPADAAPPDGPGPVLELAELTFINLPVDSIRWQVRGVDQASGLCAAIVWDYSNTRHEEQRHCDDFGSSFPYVQIERGQCGGLYYSGNAEVLSAHGCVDFGLFRHDGATDLVDVRLEVKSPLFTGTIVARGP